MYEYICMNMYVCGCVCTYMYVYVCICMNVYMYMHVCVHRRVTSQSSSYVWVCIMHMFLFVMYVVCVIICFDCSSIWLVPALLRHTDINNYLLCTSWLEWQDSAGLCCKEVFLLRAARKIWRVAKKLIRFISYYTYANI